MRNPAPADPQTQYISLDMYNNMFDMPSLPPVPDYRFIVFETVKTDTITIRVPADRIEQPPMVWYGDIDVNRDRINLGLWNPTDLRYEVQQFTIPQRNWAFEATATALLNENLWIRADAGIRYKRLTIGAEAGYHNSIGTYAAGVIRYRIF